MSHLPTGSTWYFHRGRVAMYALLRALDVQPGDEILMPGFTCIAVPGPVLGLRARPVYVDIDPNTYNLDPADLENKISDRSRVIIAQHTFGIPCDMDRIMSIANRRGLKVIEDTCHVWGSSYRNQALGSIGVAAFYSYDPGKPFIIGMGGAAVVNSDEMKRRMDSFDHEFQSPPLAETARLHLQYAAWRLTRSPRLFWVVRDLFRLLSTRGLTIATWTGDTLEGALGPDYRNRLAPSLVRRLKRVMRRESAVISRHRTLAAAYERGLRSIGFPVLSTGADAQPVLICYPLQVSEKFALLREARRAHVEIGDWFSSPVHPLAEHEWSAVRYASGTCPVAEQVARCVITLPCHAGVTTREAGRTLGFIERMHNRGLLIAPNILNPRDPIQQAASVH